MRFVDTNILLYAISRDPAETDKAERANRILAEGDISLSVQVLHEFYVQATRTDRSDPLTHDQAAGLVEAWCRFPVQATTIEVLEAALATRARFGISCWDAAILEAARASGCVVVLSEELDHDTDYDGLAVENPFAPSQVS
mgnify:FL=1